MTDTPYDETSSSAAAAEEIFRRRGNGPRTANRPLRQRPLEIIKFADMQPRLAGKPLIKGYLEQEQVSLLVGEKGCGKTFFALNRDLHIAAGCDWFGRKVRQAPVVYLAAEAGGSIQNRVVAWRREHGFESSDIPFAAIITPVDLCHPSAGDVQRVIDTVRQVGFGDIIGLLEIDTVNRAMAGGDENAPDDMGGFIHSMDLLRDALSCHVAGVHHFGKDTAGGGRGHSSLVCAVDTETQVQNGVAIITHQRDGVASTQFPFKLTQVSLGYDEDGERVTTCIVENGSDAAPAPHGKPPSPAAQKFHAALCDALLDCTAEKRTESGKFVCVAQNVWIRELDRLGLLDKAGTPNKRRALISKYRLELIATNWVACNGDFIWSTRNKE
jgi:hypothetical protein